MRRGINCIALWTYLIVFVFMVEAPKQKTTPEVERSYNSSFPRSRPTLSANDSLSDGKHQSEDFHSPRELEYTTPEMNISNRIDQQTFYDVSVNITLVSSNSCVQINESMYTEEMHKITIYSKENYSRCKWNNFLKTENSRYGAAVSGTDHLHPIINNANNSNRSSTEGTDFLQLYFLVQNNEMDSNCKSLGGNIVFRCMFAINDAHVKTKKVYTDDGTYWQRGRPKNLSLTFRFFEPYDYKEFNLRSIVEDIDTFSNYSYCSSKIPFFYALVISGELRNNSFFILFVTFNYALSTCCILLIFLTAKLSLEWRSKRSNIILINFTLAIFSQIILHFISDFSEIDESLCTIVTILCHYFTLVQFLWTSTIAYMQYRRYVQVFDEKNGFFIIKLITFAWVMPLIVITINLIIVFSVHQKAKCDDKFQVCSIINTYLLRYSVLLPLLFTLPINFIFFLLIFRHLLKRKVEFDQQSSALLEAKLAFVLFFLLDLNLIVAIIADLFSIDILALIFVTSHSLQGVLIFVVFVIRNKYSRKMYVRWIKVAREKLLLTRC